MEPSSPEARPTDSLFKGLKEAFGDRKPPKTSVLNALQSRAQRRLGVHLQDPGHSPEPPVKVSEAVKSLRDPHGRYQILGEIARGGMGVVYKGRDVDLGRDVAMKILQDRYLDDPGVLERFVEEAQIGGQLQHPGIVPVYELGVQTDERPYFAMKLIKGETLAERLSRRQDPETGRRRFLGFFEQVCQTIAFAHARRVVHRDLKPANVMIGSFGEVQVMDWGLAKVLPKGGVADERESALSTSNVRSVIATVRSREGTNSVVGSVLGTPAYMSPEQALGNVDSMDRRSDVFGLGAILCEILTGAPPYRTENGDLIEQAARADLEDARERLRECGADEALVKLCLQCLSPARRARPESAKQVAEVLGEYLSSVEERARAAELRAVESRVKARSTKILAAVAVLVLSLGAGTFIWLQNDANQRRADAEQRVAQALVEANALVGEAQGSGDLERWDQAIEELHRAEIAAESREVSQETRDDIEERLGKALKGQKAAGQLAARRDKDENMVVQLIALRIPEDEDVRGRAWPVREARRLDRDYAEAFYTYLDRDLPSMAVDDAVSALSGGPLGIEVQLAAALDHWVLERDALAAEADPPDPAGTTRLRAIAQGLDPDDPWRNDLRRLIALGVNENASLDELANKVLVELDGATQLEDQPATSLVLLGEALLRADSPDLAVAIYRRGQEVYPNDFWMSFRLALVLERLEEPSWEEAIQAYEVARALRPDMKEVQHRMGIAYQEQEDNQSALRTFERLAAADPENGNWACHVGDALWHLERREKAIAVYNRALQLNPDNAHVYHNKGMHLASQGDIDGAIETFKAAIEARPNDIHAYYHLGSLYRNYGRDTEGAELYRSLIEIEPRIKWAHNDLGIALRRLGDLEGSKAAYLRALEIDPEYPAALYNMAILLDEMGDTAGAIESYRDSIKSSPSPAAYINLGVVFWNEGEFEQAIRTWEEAYDRRQVAQLLLANLAKALATVPDPRLRDPGRALELAERAVKAIRSPYALLTLGIVHYRLGNYEEAERAIQSSMELRGTEKALQCESWLFMAMVLLRLEPDDPENTMYWYEKAVEWIEGQKELGERVDRDTLRALEEARKLLGR